MLTRILDRPLDKTSFLGICLGYYISPLVGVDIHIYPMATHVGYVQYDSSPCSGLETLHIESLLVSIVSPVSWEAEKVFVLSSYLTLRSWI
jgi:hypothetical protein